MNFVLISIFYKYSSLSCKYYICRHVCTAFTKAVIAYV